MRDDIHKSAPFAAAWRRFIKHTMREADRKDRARESAERALASDCEREISRETVQTILERCSSPERDLFGSKLAGLGGAAGHVMNQQLMDRLRLVERSGSLDPKAVERALTEVIAERRESQSRAMAGYIFRAGGKGSPESIQTIKQQLGSVSASDLAQRLMNPRSVEKPISMPQVSMDEDLR